MKSISYNIAQILENQGIIQKEDIDRCRYGLDVLISSILEVFSIFIISAFVGNFFKTLVFFAAFVPLRIYAGGYHASTRLRCFLISIAVYVIFTFILSYLPNKAYETVNILCMLLSSIAVIAFAPVIHSNKSVNEIETEYYRNISITICVIEISIIFILTMITRDNIFVTSIALGQFAEVLSMVIAILKAKITDNK